MYDEIIAIKKKMNRHTERTSESNAKGRDAVPKRLDTTKQNHLLQPTHHSRLTTHELRIQHLLLMIDAFHMHRVKILGDEFFTQPFALAFFKCTFQDFVPAIGL